MIKSEKGGQTISRTPSCSGRRGEKTQSDPVVECDVVPSQEVESGNESDDSGNELLVDALTRERAKARAKARRKSKQKINPTVDRYVPFLDGPRNGGPLMWDLLISYDGHVAGKLWDDHGVHVLLKLFVFTWYYYSKLSLFSYLLLR